MLYARTRSVRTSRRNFKNPTKDSTYLQKTQREQKRREGLSQAWRAERVRPSGTAGDRQLERIHRHLPQLKNALARLNELQEALEHPSLWEQLQKTLEHPSSWEHFLFIIFQIILEWFVLKPETPLDVPTALREIKSRKLYLERKIQELQERLAHYSRKGRGRSRCPDLSLGEHIIQFLDRTPSGKFYVQKEIDHKQHVVRLFDVHPEGLEYGQGDLLPTHVPETVSLAKKIPMLVPRGGLTRSQLQRNMRGREKLYRSRCRQASKDYRTRLFILSVLGSGALTSLWQSVSGRWDLGLKEFSAPKPQNPLQNRTLLGFLASGNGTEPTPPAPEGFCALNGTTQHLGSVDTPTFLVSGDTQARISFANHTLEFVNIDSGNVTHTLPLPEGLGSSSEMIPSVTDSGDVQFTYKTESGQIMTATYNGTAFSMAEVASGEAGAWQFTPTSRGVVVADMNGLSFKPNSGARFSLNVDPDYNVYSFQSLTQGNDTYVVYVVDHKNGGDYKMQMKKIDVDGVVSEPVTLQGQPYDFRIIPHGDGVCIVSSSWNSEASRYDLISEIRSAVNISNTLEKNTLASYSPLEENPFFNPQSLDNGKIAVMNGSAVIIFDPSTGTMDPIPLSSDRDPASLPSFTCSGDTCTVSYQTQNGTQESVRVNSETKELTHTPIPGDIREIISIPDSPDQIWVKWSEDGQIYMQKFGLANPPVVSNPENPPSHTGRVGFSPAVNLDTTDSFSNGTFTYTISAEDEASLEAAGLHFQAGRIYGEPTQALDRTITVTAHDICGNTADVPTSLHLKPVISIVTPAQNGTVAHGNLFSQTLRFSESPATLNITGADWMHSEKLSDGSWEISGTPPDACAATYDGISVTASWADSEPISQTLKVDVTNAAPVGPATPQSFSYSMDGDFSQALSIAGFSDSDDTSLTFRLTGLGNSSLPTGVSFLSDSKTVFVPESILRAADLQLELHASDSCNPDVVQQVAFNRQTPTITLAAFNQSVIHGHPIANETFSFSARPDSVEIIGGDGKFTVTPSASDPKSFVLSSSELADCAKTDSVTVRAHFPNMSPIDQTLSFSVTNAAPVGPSDALEIHVPFDQSFQRTLDKSGFSDIDDSLTFSLTGLPSGFHVEDDLSSFSGTLRDSDVTLELHASDGCHLDAVRTIRLLRDPPTIVQGAVNQSMVHGYEFNQTIRFSARPDNVTVNVSWLSVTLLEDGSYQLLGKPTSECEANYPVIITASYPNMEPLVQSVQLGITNAAPVGPAADLVIHVPYDQTFQYPLDKSGFSDVDDPSLTFSVKSVSAGVQVAGDLSSFTTTLRDSDGSFELHASDGCHLDAVRTIRLLRDPPTIVQGAANQTVVHGQAILNETFSFSARPDSVEIIGGDGKFTVTPSASDPKSFVLSSSELADCAEIDSVTVRAHFPNMPPIDQTLSFSVTNAAPSVSLSVRNFTVTPNQEFTLQLNPADFSDSDSVLRFSNSSLPEGWLFDVPTFILRGTLSPSQNATISIFCEDECPTRRPVQRIRIFSESLPPPPPSAGGSEDSERPWWWWLLGAAGLTGIVSIMYFGHRYYQQNQQKKLNAVITLSHESSVPADEHLHSDGDIEAASESHEALPGRSGSYLSDAEPSDSASQRGDDDETSELPNAVHDEENPDETDHSSQHHEEGSSVQPPSGAPSEPLEASKAPTDDASHTPAADFSAHAPSHLLVDGVAITAGSGTGEVSSEEPKDDATYTPTVGSSAVPETLSPPPIPGGDASLAHATSLDVPVDSGPFSDDLELGLEPDGVSSEEPTGDAVHPSAADSSAVPGASKLGKTLPTVLGSSPAASTDFVPVPTDLGPRPQNPVPPEIGAATHTPADDLEDEERSRRLPPFSDPTSAVHFAHEYRHPRVRSNVVPRPPKEDPTTDPFVRRKKPLAPPDDTARVLFSDPVAASEAPKSFEEEDEDGIPTVEMPKSDTPVRFRNPLPHPTAWGTEEGDGDSQIRRPVKEHPLDEPDTVSVPVSERGPLPPLPGIPPVVANPLSAGKWAIPVVGHRPRHERPATAGRGVVDVTSLLLRDRRHYAYGLNEPSSGNPLAGMLRTPPVLQHHVRVLQSGSRSYREYHPSVDPSMYEDSLDTFLREDSRRVRTDAPPSFRRSRFYDPVPEYSGALGEETRPPASGSSSEPRASATGEPKSAYVILPPPGFYTEKRHGRG